MKILVIGGGGREHAVVSSLHNEGKHELYCAPGNAGIAQLATCVPIGATDIEALAEYAADQAFDLVVVTPDDPLALGLVDRLWEKGIRAFGPTAAAARIEASKAFSKNLMRKYGIPTAAFEVFDDQEKALAYLDEVGVPVVIKADGLALGKGVYICQTKEEAVQAIDEIMVQRKFGESGARVLIEEFLTGPEVSLLCFCDGETVKPMPAAQDHKRVYDYDKGPNTGGMGAFAPTPTLTPALKENVMETIVQPTVEAMKQEGCVFKGVLYCGLMLTEQGPKVLEYNARFGDPETQAILPLLTSPLSEIMLATIDGTLLQTPVTFSDEACVCIVAASGGYPGSYQKGYPIAGLEACKNSGAQVIHAGTAKQGDGFVTAGGRVLGVVRKGTDLPSAISAAYESLAFVSFEGMHARKDIGVK
ncbi:MAG: phosphoribosylamine--glycine ligase [Clostridia bacterium]|nr:phosphoribosylamine--glycine ligase [Clostridia bacterium]